METPDERITNGNNFPAGRRRNNRMTCQMCTFTISMLIRVGTTPLTESAAWFAEVS